MTAINGEGNRAIFFYIFTRSKTVNQHDCLFAHLV